MPELKGPLGIWGYPLLNLLREFLQNIGQKSTGIRPQTNQQTSFSPVMKNVENITWTDWKGKERTITIHREIEKVE